MSYSNTAVLLNTLPCQYPSLPLPLPSTDCVANRCQVTPLPERGRGRGVLLGLVGVRAFCGIFSHISRWSERHMFMSGDWKQIYSFSLFVEHFGHTRYIVTLWQTVLSASVKSYFWSLYLHKKGCLQLKRAFLNWKGRGWAKNPLGSLSYK